MSMWIPCLRDIDRHIPDMPNPLLKCQLSLYLRSLIWYHVRMLLFLLLLLIDSRSDLDISIAHQKKSCTLYLLHKFLSYIYLFTQYRAFVSSFNSHLFPKLFSSHVKSRLADSDERWNACLSFNSSWEEGSWISVGIYYQTKTWLNFSLRLVWWQKDTPRYMV